MRYKIGKSKTNDLNEAVKEADLESGSPKLILFFSGVDEFEKHAKNIKERFPEAVTMGSTTFAAFCKEGAYKDTLLLLAFEEGIRCEASLLEDADKYALKYIERVEQCASSFHKPKNTLCLEFSSALISCEELVLSTLNAVLAKKNIPVFGGSSGDRGRAEKTMVSLNGQIYQNACVFVLIENLGGAIRFYRENIYKPTKHSFKSTKVDVRNRIVYEYNNKPAANVIAETLNTSVAKLPEYLDSYPMGRIIGDEMYIVANNSVVNGTAIQYHARIYNNAQVVLLEPDDYKKVINETLERVKRECGSPSLTLMVNCLARSMLFESNGFLTEFAINAGQELGNFVGFAGYGEQLDNQHFNQTMTLAVFE